VRFAEATGERIRREITAGMSMWAKIQRDTANDIRTIVGAAQFVPEPIVVYPRNYYSPSPSLMQAGFVPPESVLL